MSATPIALISLFDKFSSRRVGVSAREMAATPLSPILQCESTRESSTVHDDRPPLIAIAPSFSRGLRGRLRYLTLEQRKRRLLISFAAVTPISSPSAIKCVNSLAHSNKPGAKIDHPSQSQHSVNISSVHLLSGGTFKRSDRTLAF